MTLNVIKDLKPIDTRARLLVCSTSRRRRIEVYVAYGYAPARLLKGVAGGLLGRSAVEGGFSTAALGLLMHFDDGADCGSNFLRVKPTALIAQKLSGVVAVGLLYGAAVFAVNNFATAPFLSWVRSLYLHTPISFKPPMGWLQLVIHLFCVGLPIALVMHRYAPGAARRVR